MTQKNCRKNWINHVWGLLLLAALSGAGGCSAPTYRFEVMVHNHTTRPITVWLTKDGPPIEQRWASPEQLAEAQLNEKAGEYAQIIPPHSVAMEGPQKGQFPSGVHPVLRVYSGALTKLSQILAMSRPSPDRLDLILQHEGRNEYIIKESPTGGITYDYIAPPAHKRQSAEEGAATGAKGGDAPVSPGD